VINFGDKSRAPGATACDGLCDRTPTPADDGLPPLCRSWKLIPTFWNWTAVTFFLAIGGGSATPDRPVWVAEATLGLTRVAGHPLWGGRPTQFFFKFLNFYFLLFLIFFSFKKLINILLYI
jgi:hypothetical protein